MQLGNPSDYKSQHRVPRHMGFLRILAMTASVIINDKSFFAHSNKKQLYFGGSGFMRLYVACDVMM
jgi:hypothetical protein